MEDIEFLTKEHSKTLGGLHEEIQKLQGRCDELTFRLHFTESSASDIELDGTHIETINCLKAQLEDVTKSLGTELHRKNEMIKDLHNQLLEANLEMKDVSEKYTQSCASLEAKSKTIAFLTSKLNQVKTKLAARQTELISPTPPQGRPEKDDSLKRNGRSDPLNGSMFFAEESFENACFRSLPPSLGPITPKMLVPTPPTAPAKNGTYARHARRYSAPRLRTANETLPFALLPVDKINSMPVPQRGNKKLILPPIPIASRETQSNGPMVGNLQSPESFKHPQKTSHSTRVKDF